MVELITISKTDIIKRFLNLSIEGYKTNIRNQRLDLDVYRSY